MARRPARPSRGAPRPGRRQPGGSRGTPRPRPSGPPREAQLTVERVGRGGNGRATLDGATVAIPFALVGERVVASVREGRGEATALTEPSPERVEPPCPHHGRIGAVATGGGARKDEAGTDEAGPACGACALQHWADAPYAAWKRDLLVEALARAGIEAPVDPLVRCAPGERRRLVLAARLTAAGTVLGFRAARSDRIVDMRACTVARPEIVAALPDLRALCGALLPPGGTGRVSVLATEAGLDVRLDPDRPPEDGARRSAVALAAPFARVSVGDEVLMERAAPTLRFGAVAVTPPPGAFVQAVGAAERAMANLVTAHLAPCRRVADLYAGSGTFALRLAARAAVHAVEGEATPLAALDRAWREAGRSGVEGLRRVTTERRDLDRRPLTVAELDGLHAPGAKPFDGVAFDPPRAGAEAQCRALARSAVPRVAAVSCNPVTLARDLRTLVDGGYRIERIVPIDQFLWTPHLEAVVLLTR